MFQKAWRNWRRDVLVVIALLVTAAAARGDDPADTAKPAGAKAGAKPLVLCHS
jgi:hypothetical protein